MKKTVILTIALILTLSCTSLWATVLEKMPIETLTRVSTDIVRGVVEELRTEKDAKSGRIYTYTTVKASEWIKGQAVKSITIRQIGGSWDGLEMKIAGTPSFTVGEEVLVFVEKHENLYFLRGMGQGCFSIAEKDGVKIATQKLGHVAVLDLNQQVSAEQKIEYPQAIVKELGALLKELRSHLSVSNQ